MSDISTLIEGLNLDATQIEKLTLNLNTLKSSKLLELDSDVASSKEGARLTENGIEMIGQALAGETLRFTKVQLGNAVKDGVIVNKTAEEILSMTALVNPCGGDLSLSGCNYTGGGTATVHFVINNSNNTDGFWLREIGLFAKVGNGPETLYCYKNYGALATYIPGSDSATTLNVTVSLVTIVDQATNVHADIVSDVQYVYYNDFNTHLNDDNAHRSIIPQRGAEVTSDIRYIWVPGSDNQLHSCSVTNLQTVILGNSVNELPNLSSRLAQTEMNIANLYSQLNSMSDTGLKANLLLAEDFTNGASHVDNFKLDVVNVAKGADNFSVRSLEGIKEGHYYTLSNGKKTQYVRVKSTARVTNELNTVFIEGTIAYASFQNTKPYLYRTTGLVIDNQFNGAGRSNDFIEYFGSDEWRGEGTADEVTLLCPTTPEYSKKFKLSGDTDFTADGEFTLKEVTG